MEIHTESGSSCCAHRTTPFLSCLAFSFFLIKANCIFLSHIPHYYLANLANLPQTSGMPHTQHFLEYFFRRQLSLPFISIIWSVIWKKISQETKRSRGFPVPAEQWAVAISTHFCRMVALPALPNKVFLLLTKNLPKSHEAGKVSTHMEKELHISALLL